jgi:hypothetical protein
MLEHWSQGLQIGLPNLMVSFFFQLWGQYKAIKSLAFISSWGRLKSFFPISALTPSVKPLGLVSTFAPIGMLDLGLTLALIPSV